jgi:hypothetical protein
MRARSMGSLGLGLLLLAALSSAAVAKPKVAILGLEVIGSLDPEQVKLAKQLTIGLRERASAGAGPYELAPNSDKELVDEKLMNNCGNEALVCMSPIGLAMRADFLMFGNIEKVDKGFHITIKLIRVATKMPLPTFSEIVPVAEVKNDPKGVAKRAYAKMTATDEGTVTVRVANADRATVYVDDQPVGTTASGVLTFTVGEGKHRLAVVAADKGWKRYEEELALVAGDQRNIPVELSRTADEPKAGKPKTTPSGPTGPAGPTGPTGPSDGGLHTEMRHETIGAASSSGGSGWTTAAVATTVLTVASAGVFAVSWYKLSELGKAPGDTDGSLAYSCAENDPRKDCKNGPLYSKLSWVGGVGAGALAVFTVYAFYKGSSGSERAVTSGRSTRARRELTVTPVVSASGGGAALRLDW